ncbi:hypothetical protein RirG_054720 [Rhizophagus irregularis DAOM 197198w]|nr:hypothetical protein RirG_054720 [Rhizophagus irregularis DAOM 197198w]
MNGLLGSFPNSKRAIELELMRIITQNSRLNCLISAQSDNQKLMEALSLVQNRLTTGSLAAYDGFDFAELYRFMRTFHQNIDVTITGCEEFPGEMITPKKQVSLPDTIYKLLIKYYNDTYNRDFVSIAEFVSNNLTSSNSENQPIVVSPNVSQFGRIRIATEIFGSALAPRYQRSSYVTSKFIQDDESVDIFLGQVQFYFEHTVPLPTGAKTHRLAFIKWYMWVPREKTRFHCRIDNQDDKSCNIELWKDYFHELSRDCIIPIHNIYSRFLPCKFTIGNRKLITYMAVIPINRQFHL